MSAVDEEHEAGELLSAHNVAVDEAVEFLQSRLSDASIAIARQIHDVPLVVDVEVVDEQRLARLRRSFCQTLALGQHIDEA